MRRFRRSRWPGINGHVAPECPIPAAGASKRGRLPWDSLSPIPTVRAPEALICVTPHDRMKESILAHVTAENALRNFIAAAEASDVHHKEPGLHITSGGMSPWA